MLMKVGELARSTPPAFGYTLSPTAGPSSTAISCDVKMHYMPNIASALKNEVSRIAKKEIRAEVQTIKKVSAQYRSQIAALKRTVAALARKLRQGSRAKAFQDDADGGAAGTKRRYSAKRLAAHRAKLGLSAENYGRLCGVSGQTIYKWE